MKDIIGAILLGTLFAIILTAGFYIA